MRWTFLPLTALLGACATEAPGPYEAYDPASIDDMATPAAVAGAADAVAAAQTYASADTQVLTALAGPMSGRWMWPGEKPGYDAGNAACFALGADHVCDQAELERAQALGDLAHFAPGIKVWYPLADQAAHANCRGFTYDTADHGWGGTGRVAHDADGAHWELGRHLDAGFSTDCLKDPAQCVRTMPSDGGCNESLYIPCCG